MYKTILFIGMLILSTNLQSQNVGVNTMEPEATLHVKGNSAGAEKLAIDFETISASPLMVNGTWVFTNESYQGEIAY